MCPYPRLRYHRSQTQEEEEEEEEEEAAEEAAPLITQADLNAWTQLSLSVHTRFWYKKRHSESRGFGRKKLKPFTGSI
jgi:hypothetical protein